ncbi:MAG TPA: hypothetical protein VFP71_09215, partial [Candidatus Angelobacter sp.]|nr:hypothetical protein [Candidatus Angelobacter sp.]
MFKNFWFQQSVGCFFLQHAVSETCLSVAEVYLPKERTTPRSSEISESRNETEAQESSNAGASFCNVSFCSLRYVKSQKKIS